MNNSFRLYSSNPNEIIEVALKTKQKLEKDMYGYYPVCCKCKQEIELLSQYYEVTRSAKKTGTIIFEYHERCYENDSEIRKLMNLKPITMNNKLRFVSKG